MTLPTSTSCSRSRTAALGGQGQAAGGVPPYTHPPRTWVHCDALQHALAPVHHDVGVEPNVEPLRLHSAGQLPVEVEVVRAAATRRYAAAPGLCGSAGVEIVSWSGMKPNRVASSRVGAPVDHLRRPRVVEAPAGPHRPRASRRRRICSRRKSVAGSYRSDRALSRMIAAVERHGRHTAARTSSQLKGTTQVPCAASKHSTRSVSPGLYVSDTESHRTRTTNPTASAHAAKTAARAFISLFHSSTTTLAAIMFLSSFTRAIDSCSSRFSFARSALETTGNRIPDSGPRALPGATVAVGTAAAAAAGLLGEVLVASGAAGADLGAATAVVLVAGVGRGGPPATTATAAPPAPPAAAAAGAVVAVVAAAAVADDTTIVAGPPLLPAPPSPVPVAAPVPAPPALPPVDSRSLRCSARPR